MSPDMSLINYWSKFLLKIWNWMTVLLYTSNYIIHFYYCVRWSRLQQLYGNALPLPWSILMRSSIIQCQAILWWYCWFCMKVNRFRIVLIMTVYIWRSCYVVDLLYVLSEYQFEISMLDNISCPIFTSFHLHRSSCAFLREIHPSSIGILW